MMVFFSQFELLEGIMLNTTEFQLFENLTLLDFKPHVDVTEKYFYFAIKIVEIFQTDTSNALKGLFFYLFLLIFGNAALGILILYEKQGMDPQKRTINNQLLSKTCLILMWQNTFLCPLSVLMSPHFFDIGLGL